MNRLTEEEKQQIRNKVFIPGAKFANVLLFEPELKFKNKLIAWCNKIMDDTGWKIKSSYEFNENNVYVSFQVQITEDKESLSLDVAITNEKRN